MPLYLSSNGLGVDPSRLTAPAPGTTAVIVLNALDPFGATRNRDLPLEIADLARLGWDATELDLRDYATDDQGLAERLAGVGLMWVVGGNSFALARAMTLAGLRPVITERLNDPDFVYAGYSAGAVVAGPDLHAIELVDDPDQAADDVPSTTPADTLALVPFRIVPHWRSDHPESAAIEHVALAMQERGLAHRCLHDGEALWVDGDAVTLVGAPA